MRQKLVVGNWKMHGNLVQNQVLVEGVLAGLAGVSSSVEIAVCVPFPYLAQVGAMLRAGPIGLGAQTLSEHMVGAHTGEVSAAMLSELGCRYVLVGHSERRALQGEGDAQVAAKYAAAVAAGLVPILCVGETADERARGATLQVVSRQLAAVVAVAGVAALGRGVVAYEPVWAIGTGVTATPSQAQEVHASIREAVARQDQEVAASLRILYGGSVNAGNAAVLFAQPDVDGGLVGGASLQAEGFLAICQSAAS